MQVAMRAPRRDMIGFRVLVEGIEYTVGDQGVVNAHEVHVAGFKSLGYHECKLESPDVAEVTTLSEDEAKAVTEMRKAKAAAEYAEKTAPEPAKAAAEYAEKTAPEPAKAAPTAAPVRK